MYFKYKDDLSSWSCASKVQKKSKSLFSLFSLCSFIVLSPSIRSEKGSFAILEYFQEVLKNIDDKENKKILEKELMILKNLRGSLEEKMEIINKRKESLKEKCIIIDQKKEQLEIKKNYYDESSKKIDAEELQAKEMYKKSKEILKKEKEKFITKGAFFTQAAEKLIQIMKTEKKDIQEIIEKNYEKEDQEFNNTMNNFLEKKINYKDYRKIYDIESNIFDKERALKERIKEIIEDSQEELDNLKKIYMLLLDIYDEKNIKEHKNMENVKNKDKEIEEKDSNEKEKIDTKKEEDSEEKEILDVNKNQNEEENSEKAEKNEE